MMTMAIANDDGNSNFLAACRNGLSHYCGSAGSVLIRSGLFQPDFVGGLSRGEKLMLPSAGWLLQPMASIVAARASGAMAAKPSIDFVNVPMSLLL